ncbi:nuclear receptor binding SET domain protein-like [Anopheles ziemanni]|nr:nuclear receptor binding SET domain protein-like [Anopheles ziemanni]
MFVSPTTTKSRVKSQERTPTGQQISGREKNNEPALETTGENTFTDMNSNSISEIGDYSDESLNTGKKNPEVVYRSIDDNRKSVHQSPSGRNLLKQLQTSLSPKLTEINIDGNRRVSRYGRHQKQKENINYVPVELMKFVGKSPAKIKPKKEVAMIDIKIGPDVQQLEVNMAHATDVKELGTSFPAETSVDNELPPMLPMLEEHRDNVLDMDAINIIGMNVSFENINDDNIFLENALPQNTIDHNHPSDVDSAKGSSIDLVGEYRVGEIYWGAQTQKTIHWPCIVRIDPETNQIIRMRSNQREIHVAFFGDRGRRGWIREAYIASFRGLADYCSRVDNYEYGKAVKAALKVALRNNWKVASQQAEEFNAIDIELRLEKFDLSVELERVRLTSIRVIKGQGKQNKRTRSPTPESPSYDVIPIVTEHTTKRMKLQQISTLQNTIAGPSDAAMHGSEEKGTLFSDDSKHYTELAFKLIVNLGRTFLLDDQSTDEKTIMLEQYARKITSLKSDGAHHQKSKRTVVLRKLTQMRNLCHMLDEFMAEHSGEHGDSVAVRIKKEKPTLEEEFIFQIDPKSITKGLPKGNVCCICKHPQSVVKCMKCHRHMHLHCMTADLLEQVKLQTMVDERRFNCNDCSGSELKDVLVKQSCFVCNDELEETKNETKCRCAGSLCVRQYHISCLRLFPQFAVINSQSIICPYHVCHTCVADDPRGKASNDKTALVRCIKCPSSYHPDLRCIPAGSEMLTTQQLICPKHSLDQIALNVNWCFLCCKGGDLICCETCPNAIHQDCLPFQIPDGKYFCEECESGRLPLYNEIVIAKYSSFRWWPALIMPPSEISDYLLQQKPSASSICVKFFQSHTVAWMNRRRMYLYQHDDSENLDTKKSGSLDKQYRIAMAEASKIYQTIQEMKTLTAPVVRKKKIPTPVYQKIKTNRYVAPLKQPQSDDDSNCYCRSDDEDPCGPTSSCINRTMMFECIPNTCPAKNRCSNQRFAKRIYPSLEVRHFADKGYGLVAKEAIARGAFVIEYVGEVINMAEFNRRIKEIQERKITNYYFLTVDPDMTIDAGTKGNISRFINHSCEPNCETQKWTIGNARVIGLFAIKDIHPGEELTFNYNLESLGNKKRVCLCGTSKCSGFIGEKYRSPKKDTNNSNSSGPSLLSIKKIGVNKAKKKTLLKGAGKPNKRKSDDDILLVPKAEPETINLDDLDYTAISPTFVIKTEKVDNDIET